MDREGCAVLYGPKPASFRSNKDDKNDIYDIVVHTEKHKSQSLSIFRTGSEPEARYSHDIKVSIRLDSNFVLGATYVK